MRKIILVLFLLVFLTACVEQTNENYRIVAKDGQVYYFTGECIASRIGDLVVTCYKDSERVLSVQATSLEILEDE